MKSYDKPRLYIKKQRYHFINKVSYSQSYRISYSQSYRIFLVVMYRYDSWTIKKAESQTDVFEVWCWKRLRVPWTTRRSNQPILKEISPEYSLEGLLLKPKLQYFDHQMRRTNSLEKTLMLGKTEGRRRRGRQDEMLEWHHWLKGHEFEPTQGDGEGQGSLACCNSWGLKESDMT